MTRSTAVPRWREYTIDQLKADVEGSLAIGPFGSRMKANCYVPFGVPVIRGNNLSGTRAFCGEFVYISDEMADSMKSCNAYADDLVFPHRGAIGEVGIVPRDGKRYMISSSLMKLTCNLNLANPLFLFYFFRSAVGRHELLKNASTVGTPGIGQPLTSLRSIRVHLPQRKEQDSIAHILGTLDDKIDLNRRMNETLEAMARAIFKSWFVDFDPVRATVAQLCEERILEIGDGYRARNSELGVDGLPFARAGNLTSGFDLEGAEYLCHASVARAGSKISKTGDVAFTSKGTVGRVARVDDSTPEFVYAPQICYWRSIDPEKLHPVILYCWMTSDDFGGQVQSYAGQTDMAPYISLSDQRRIFVPRFAASQAEVGKRIEVILARKAFCVRESRILAALRDTLLPKLLSGEISVAKAEKLVGQAT